MKEIRMCTLFTACCIGRHPTQPTGRPQRGAALLSLAATMAFLGGCASLPGGTSTSGTSPGAPIVQRAQDWVQVLTVKGFRSAGERELAPPGVVAQELGCGVPGAPLARSERSSVLPERPRPGTELHHRWVYAACPAPGEQLAGTLTRRLVQDGRTVFEDRVPLSLRPGRWALEVFIGIPREAQAGAYRMELRFERRGLLLSEPASFAVAQR
jgi:hypothetical protein